MLEELSCFFIGNHITRELHGLPVYTFKRAEGFTISQLFLFQFQLSYQCLSVAQFIENT